MLKKNLTDPLCSGSDGGVGERRPEVVAGCTAIVSARSGGSCVGEATCLNGNARERDGVSGE